MKKEVGFIGLGQMGRWMALNLLKAGFDLTVFDSDAKATALLIDSGAKGVDSPSDL